MSNLHVYIIDDGARHWYIAKDESHALAQYVDDTYGGSVDDYLKDYPDATVSLCDGNKTLTIDFDPDHEIDGNQEVTKTYANVDSGCAYEGYGHLSALLWPECVAVTVDNID